MPVKWLPANLRNHGGNFGSDHVCSLTRPDHPRSQTLAWNALPPLALAVTYSSPGQSKHASQSNLQLIDIKCGPVVVREEVRCSK